LPKQLRPALVSPFSLLLLKHHYPTFSPFTFFLVAETPQQPFIIFPDAETPLFSTFHFLLKQSVHIFIAETTFIIFPDAETPQPFIIFPDAETPLFNTFHFFPLPKHSSPPFSHIFIAETTPSSTCFDFLPSVAETPLSTTFHFLPVAETHSPATLHHFPDAETPCSAL
jgi:hypothetical protein